MIFVQHRCFSRSGMAAAIGNNTQECIRLLVMNHMGTNLPNVSKLRNEISFCTTCRSRTIHSTIFSLIAMHLLINVHTSINNNTDGLFMAESTCLNTLKDRNHNVDQIDECAWHAYFIDFYLHISTDTLTIRAESTTFSGNTLTNTTQYDRSRLHGTMGNEYCSLNVSCTYRNFNDCVTFSNS